MGKSWLRHEGSLGQKTSMVRVVHALQNKPVQTNHADEHSMETI